MTYYIYIDPMSYYILKELIQWREQKYGYSLSNLQKIKVARIISHAVYPTENYWGYKGHEIRETMRYNLLKSIGVEYIK